MRSFVSHLKPKNVFFRKYKKFGETKFLFFLENISSSFMSADLNKNDLFLTNSFSKIVEKHVPLKNKILRRNYCLFSSKGTKENYLFLTLQVTG